MKVLTLDDVGFARCVARLEAMTSAFAPDLVVGIASGGVRVAEGMWRDVAHGQVCVRRPGTAVKNRVPLLGGVLRRLPRCVADWLRIVEARLFVSRRRVTPLVLDEGVTAMVSAARRVLVVDDAVDTGVTLRRVVDAIGGVGGEREVVTAVITVTTRKPLVVPDFCVYNDGTLIRFPWSKDFR